MQLHQKIKPHHHVAIWAFAALAFVASVTYYNVVKLQLALAQEPSAQTKRFFGFDGDDKNQNFTMPAVCERKTEQERMQVLSSEMQSLGQQMQSYSNTQDPNLTEEQRAANQQKMAELQQKMTAYQAEVAALQKVFEGGPSNDCKIAMVRQVVTQMETMNSKMDGKFLATVAKVDALAAKVEGVIPKLKEAGIDQPTLDKITKNVVTIKTQNAVLKSFFQKMRSSMQQWINNAKANPTLAFDQMQKGTGIGVDDTQSAHAAAAADSMVTAFTELVTILEQISQEKSQ